MTFKKFDKKDRSKMLVVYELAVFFQINFSHVRQVPTLQFLPLPFKIQLKFVDNLSQLKIVLL
jgi:hypothetical protein